MPPFVSLSTEVAQALRAGLPVVALESAVITHGLPQPENLLLAQALEQEVRQNGAVPATIALMDGRVWIGLSTDQMQRLSTEPGARKISRRDFGLALERKENGGTTVAATLIAARMAGIRVFATGGIGGVHRQAPFDVSADLPELGRSPLVVVCAGAKSILDLPATVEVLETMGVTILGYQTDHFPAFYAASSGLPVNARIETPDEAARIARAQWEFGLDSGVLVVQPPPAESALEQEQVERLLEKAMAEAQEQNIHGSGVTPFLLQRMGHLSEGASLQANLALLRNNARLAAKIAAALHPRQVI